MGRVVFAFLLLLAVNHTAGAGDTKAAEAWLAAQISEDKVADFDRRPGCSTRFDPFAEPDSKAACHRISGEFLARLLSHVGTASGPHRVRIKGALIAGDVDLATSAPNKGAWIEDSRIDGDLILADADLKRPFALNGCFLTGSIIARRLRSQSYLLFGQGTRIGGAFSLIDGNIEGLVIIDSVVKGDFSLSTTRIAKGLDAERSTFIGSSDLSDAIVGGTANLEASHFLSDLDATNFAVGGDLFLRNGAIVSGALTLDGVRVGGDLDLSAAWLFGDVDATAMSIGGDLACRENIWLHGSIDFDASKISGNADFQTATILGHIGAENVIIGGDLFMNGASTAGDIDIAGAHIDGDLELSDASLDGSLYAVNLALKGDLRLSRATVRRELNLQGAKLGQNWELNAVTIYGDVGANNLALAMDLDATDRAYFAGKVDLSAAKIGLDLNLMSSTFEKGLSAPKIRVGNNAFLGGYAEFGGVVDLYGAVIGGNLEVTNSAFDQKFQAINLTVSGALFMSQSTIFRGPVVLRAATIGNEWELSGAHFVDSLDATDATVGGYINAAGDTFFFRDVAFYGAKIGLYASLAKSKFERNLSIQSASIQRDLFLEGSEFAGDVNLYGLGAGSNIQLGGAHFHGKFTATRANVGGFFLAQNNAIFDGDVRLGAAKIGADLEISDSALNGSMFAPGMVIAGDVKISKATFGGTLDLTGTSVAGRMGVQTSTFHRPVTADRIHVSNGIFISDSDFGSLALGGAIATELDLQGLRWRCADVSTSKPSPPFKGLQWPLGTDGWKDVKCAGNADPSIPSLNLRNTQIGLLQDTRDTWPPSLELEGLRYDRLGNQDTTVEAADGTHSVAEWTDWLARDRPFSPQPYTQLGAILLAGGHRDGGETILIAGRDQERSVIWKRHSNGWMQWLMHEFGGWFWLSIYAAVAGYGIGMGTFRVLIWVGVAVGVSTIVLWNCPYARERGIIWCIGASTHRLLPFVELSKEFEDFFNNTPPDGGPKKLNRPQTAFFAGIAVLGWILGFFLLAAMGGLTGKS